jgi:hypothetical protein
MKKDSRADRNGTLKGHKRGTRMGFLLEIPSA